MIENEKRGQNFLLWCGFLERELVQDKENMWGLLSILDSLYLAGRAKYKESRILRYTYVGSITHALKFITNPLRPELTIITKILYCFFA